MLIVVRTFMYVSKNIFVRILLLNKEEEKYVPFKESI